VIFGLIAADGRGAREYLAEVRTGSVNRRWQAAFELSKVLQAGKDPALKDPAFVGEIVRLYDDSSEGDPRVRRYLALALGRLGNRRAVPSLLKVVGDAAGDSETLIYSVWALGSIGDPSAVPGLVAASRHEDPGVRKAAVHALGPFAGEESEAGLVAALADPAPDVAWNAAIALGRRGDPRARDALLLLLDRDYLAKAGGDGPGTSMPAEQQDEVLLQVLAAAKTAPDARLRPRLEALRDSDSNPKVREAARAALDAPPAAH
jgi:HEAT repeat protein